MFYHLFFISFPLNNLYLLAKVKIIEVEEEVLHKINTN